MLKPRYALTAQLVYAAIGLLGLPVFSTGGGPGYVLSPSFGFVIGFAVCALIVSLFVRKALLALIDKRTDKQRGFLIIKIVLYSLMSVISMYICGVAYMYLILNFYLGQTVTIGYVIVNAAGIFFFIDIIKFALAIPLGMAVLRRTPSIR
jgi:biotin transport system substrate-specific component